MEVDLTELTPQVTERESSAALMRGVGARIAALGFRPAGFNAYVTSAVPAGSGLSSSAAYEVLMGNIFNTFFCGNALTPVELAKIGQKVLRDVDEVTFRRSVPALRRQVGDRAILHALHFFSEDRRAALETEALEDFDAEQITGVIHFAASSQVGESMTDPIKYDDNNLWGTTSLLESMAAHGVDKIVFSSTAATYGEPTRVPILESDATLPTNCYGETKLALDYLLAGVRATCSIWATAWASR